MLPRREEERSSIGKLEGHLVRFALLPVGLLERALLLGIVNAVVRTNHISLDGAGWEQGTPGEGATFEPLQEDPFVGDWTFEAVGPGRLALPPMSQTYLRRKR